MTFLLPVIEKKYFNLAGSANKNASKKKNFILVEVFKEIKLQMPFTYRTSSPLVFVVGTTVHLFYCVMGGSDILM